MTQLSKEKLVEIRDYDTCVTLEESAEMARRLLAAEAREPVELPKSVNNSIIAEQLEHILSDMTVTEHQRAIITCAVDRLNKNAERLQQAPQPVAVPHWIGVDPASGPDHSVEVVYISQPIAGQEELLSAMEEVLRISDRDHEAWQRVREGITACRAAMLQGKAEPVSQPYKLPDGWKLVPVEPTAEMLSSAKEWTGLTNTAEVVYRAMLSAAPVNPEFTTQWIPCSARMPPEATMVLGRCDNDYDFVNLLGGHLKIFCMGEWRILPGAEITHWMPLPAAPQEPTK